MKKFWFWLAIAFLVFFIAFNPNEAAEVFKGIGSWIATLFRGFGTFLGNLAD